MIIDFINRYKSEYGVEPMCRVLSEHGCSIAPSTYYDARNRSASRRALRDEELKAAVSRVHAENYSVYGARKVWLEMRREGIDVARCTVERLMGVLGLEGARRGKAKRTTIADPQGRRADDLVQRKFNGCAKCVVGSRLYLCFDVVGLGVRRVRDRCVFTADSGLEDCDDDGDTVGTRCDRARDLDSTPRRDYRTGRAHSPQRPRVARRIQPVVATPTR